MKQKILIRRINKNIQLPEFIAKGDWLDLRAAETIRFKAPQSGTLKSKTVDGKEEKYRNVSFDFQMMPLGIAVKLPDGYEAMIIARSSLPKGFGVMLANNVGLIDGVTTKGTIGYNGNDDEWKAPLIALRDTTISENERICQCRLQLSQKATIWQKIKWLFTSKFEIIEVDELPNKNNREGFGSSGKQ